MPTPKLGHIPATPGVYQMIDGEGVMIYIGKSLNLKNRVRSYFSTGANLNFAKKKMVKLVSKVNYIETHSDLEALILETNMIKEHRPKYNVLMKDDKNLSYIKITDDPIPLVTRTRSKTNTGTYFGPYSQYLNVGSTLHELKKLFCLGNHTRLKKGKQPPCMDFYIGICPGHCTGEYEKIETYKKNLEQFKNFMNGDVKQILTNLENQMMQYAKQQRFEEAARIKNRMEQLNQIHDRQIVRDVVGGDYDVLILLQKYKKVFAGCTQIRNGKIVGVYHHILMNPGNESEDTLFQNFIMSKYIDEDWSGSILLAQKYELELVEKFLLKNKIHVEIPQRGDKLDLIRFAKNDLLNFALNKQMSELANTTLRKSDMVSVVSMLFPDNPIPSAQKDINFECYDISHHQGENTVASKSVIHNGKTQNAKYKKYTIKTLKTGKIDDFASMHEVLARRTRAHCEGKDMLPDLIIVDGGKGQLSRAKDAIESIYTAYTNTPERVPLDQIVRMCSLAKREEEVFISGMKDPIIIKKGSPELMLLQRARDEAHRFAINFNRQKREKSYTKTVLEEIPGIGPKTRQALLQKFGSLSGIENADEKELEKIVSIKQLQSLKEYGIVIP